jgi:organic radical activating enzyme
MRDKPYCNAPWLGLYYEGTQGCRPCCEWKGETFEGTIKEYEKSDYLRDFKKRMYDDKESLFCRECIHNEKLGKDSRRTFYEQYDLQSYCGGEEVCPDGNCNSPDGITKIVRLDYRAGNKCNMMCRMCGPSSSSLLEEESVKHTGKDFILHLDTNDVYDLDLSECEEISILGGEPSIDLGVRKFMNHIADNYPKIRCVVTTNGTNASKKWFDTLIRFCDGVGLQIILSIDATGPTQEFQRKSNIKWNAIKSNIEKYKQASEGHEGCDISIQMTCSAINLVTIDKWWDEFINRKIKIEPNQVWWPKGMAVSCIPPDLKQKSIDFLKNWIDNYKPNSIVALGLHDDHNVYETVNTLINILKTTEYTGTKEFKDIQNRYDGYRDENILDLDTRFKAMML